MTNRVTNRVVYSLKAIAKRFFGVLVCVGMLLSCTQTAALATSLHAMAQSGVVLGAIGTMSDKLLSEEALSEEALSEKREQRREWQSHVSGTSEINHKNVDDETVRERLNINEITETMKDNLNLDPDADAKAAQSYRLSR